MSNTWQNPFRTLREQFLEASRAGWRVELTLTTFPCWEASRRWYAQEIEGRLSDEAVRRGDQESRETIWGDAAAVDRYGTLATAAGQALPVDFQPQLRLFPLWNELGNHDPHPLRVWGEFLFIACAEHFSIEEDWPVAGSRIAWLQGNPFLVSSLAVERFLTPEPPAVEEYRRRTHTVAPWVGAAAPPPTLPTPGGGENTAVDEWLTYRDAALLLDKSKTRVCVYVQQGTLTSNGLTGKKKRVSRSSVSRLALARKKQLQQDKGQAVSDADREEQGPAPAVNLHRPSLDELAERASRKRSLK